MAEAGSFLESIKGYGGYSTTLTLIVFGLLTWWKVLPSLIDAFSNRQSKIEERMGKLLEDATARFQREIAAADERHSDCMEGQRKLIEEVEAQRAHSARQDLRISEQGRTIEGLKAQIIQMQVSAIRTESLAPSPIIEAAMQSLENVQGVGE